MSARARIAMILVLGLTSVAARSEPRFNASFAGFTDDNNVHSLDLDASYAPNTQWMLGAGVGTIKSPSDQANVDGTNLRALVEVHSAARGVRAYYRNYSDSSFEVGTIGARAFFRSGAATISLIGESRDFNVDYVTGTVTTASTAKFTGTGIGAGLNYSASGWDSYIEGVFYSYGSQLDSFTTATGGGAAPGVPGIPVTPTAATSRIPVVGRLTNSFVTRNQGVLDHQISAGIERGFERSALRFDWVGIEDAASSETSNSVSAGYRYSLTSRTNFAVTLGVTDADAGSAMFGGLAFTVHN